MADLAVIVPSRGRPRQLAELVDAVELTAAGSVEVVACLDLDDPDLPEYRRLLPGLRLLVGQRCGLVKWTNIAAETLLDRPDPPTWLASLGDDHRPRTRGWDTRLTTAITELGVPGFAYGNDLYQGERMPTAWVVSAQVVKAVGWMMLPTVEHLYPDAAVLALGQASGRIVYCPDVIIEHLHPMAGKAGWDASYRASNASARYAADQAAFTAWQRDGGLAADVDRLRHIPAGVA